MASDLKFPEPAPTVPQGALDLIENMAVKDKAVQDNLRVILSVVEHAFNKGPAAYRGALEAVDKIARALHKELSA